MRCGGRGKVHVRPCPGEGCGVFSPYQAGGEKEGQDGEQEDYPEDEAGADDDADNDSEDNEGSFLTTIRQEER